MASTEITVDMNTLVIEVSLDTAGPRGLPGLPGIPISGFTPMALTPPTELLAASDAGVLAGAWSSSAQRDAAILAINTLTTRVNELEAQLKTLGFVV